MMVLILNMVKARRLIVDAASLSEESSGILVVVDNVDLQRGDKPAK